MFLFTSFKMMPFTFKFIMHLYWFLCMMRGNDPHLFSPTVGTVDLILWIELALCSPVTFWTISFTFLVSMCMGLFLAPHSVPLVHLSVSVLIPHCHDYWCYSFTQNLGGTWVSAVLVLRVSLSYDMKNPLGINWNDWINLGDTWNL